jgi:small subunit ribosomal protein S8
MVKDSVSDLIISLKNASKRGKEALTTPYTKMNLSILEVLKKEGFIEDVEKHGKDLKKHINITLKYNENGKPKINEVKRISKQSKRIYKGVNEIHPVRNGYGLLVLSTPEGIISGKQVKKLKIGGEVLFEIW